MLKQQMKNPGGIKCNNPTFINCKISYSNESQVSKLNYNVCGVKKKKLQGATFHQH
jgi:hypothetical protein